MQANTPQRWEYREGPRRAAPRGLLAAGVPQHVRMLGVPCLTRRMQGRGSEVHLIPAQVDQLRRAQAMPVGAHHHEAAIGRSRGMQWEWLVIGAAVLALIAYKRTQRSQVPEAEKEGCQAAVGRAADHL
jgi:hypothetical protein